MAQRTVQKWLVFAANGAPGLRFYEPGGREFDNLAVFGQVDRPKGDPEGVSAQRE